ncbi:MAG: F0F1 ATP synthase subunit B [Actinomycetota bacterium]
MRYQLVGMTVAQGEEQTTTTEEEHNPILPETDELIFGSLAFLIVFVALAKFALPQIRRMMEARTQKIQGDLEGAEKARTDAEGILSRYEEQLRDARTEASRIIEEARKTADQMRKDLLAKAEDESRQIVARAQEEIRAERDRACDQLRRSVGELSVELAARVVGESLDEERHLRLVDGYIDELAGSGDGEGDGKSE